MAHVRWFSHGGDTFLDETAGPKELFLLDRCDDIELVSFSEVVCIFMGLADCLTEHNCWQGKGGEMYSNWPIRRKRPF